MNSLVGMAAQALRVLPRIGPDRALEGWRALAMRSLSFVVVAVFFLKSCVRFRDHC